MRLWKKTVDFGDALRQVDTATLVRARTDLKQNLARRPENEDTYVWGVLGELDPPHDWWAVRASTLSAVRYELWRRNYLGAQKPV